MKVYFVIDLMDGKVVRAFEGRRDNYYPIEYFSNLVDSSDPFDVLEVVRPRYLYVADLDRIMGIGNNFSLIDEISRGFHVIADCGFREADEVLNLNFIPVLGTETFDLYKLDEVKSDFFVSLDIRGGRVLSNLDFSDTIEYLNSFNILGLIVLEIDRVGTCSLNFERIEKALKLSENPVYVGGGVGSLEDLMRLRDMGCEGALISTALHRGLIDLDVVRRGEI